MKGTGDGTNETEEALALRVNKLICLGQPASVQKLLAAGADPDGRVKGVPHIVAAARAGAGKNEGMRDDFWNMSLLDVSGRQAG